MKLLVFLLLLTGSLRAQDQLIFNKRFVECEDRWVAFPPNKDSSYSYGFIYIDAQAGLTLNYEGTFRVSASGLFMPHKVDSANIKYRLQPNNLLVALIPPDKFAELLVDAVPDWLHVYKGDTNSIARLYRWGFLYNGWNECEKALTYLERAQKLDPKFKGLQVELAFSYNCLKQYDQAISILQDALTANPSDAYVNKELIYAEIESGQLEKASASCRQALKNCPDTYHWENCYNLLHAYYVKKDKANFQLWLEETKKWNSKNQEIMSGIEKMESEMYR
jgi:tetratricopeptide (TPR) repeat protein